MGLDEFIRKYDGKGIDFDGKFGAQCMDCYRQYVKEVLQYPQSPPVEGAKDVWNTYLPDYFRRVENTPHGVPDKGDIVIFGTTIGRYGHISIFVEGDANRFKSFDQNYPLGSLCHIQGHTYNGVIGWLRPLVKNNGDDMPSWFKTLLQERNLTIDNESEIRSIFDRAKKYETEYQDVLKRLSEAEDRAGDAAKSNSLLVEKVAILEGEVDNLKQSLAEERVKSDKTAWEAEKLSILAQSQREEIAGLNETINDLKSKKPLSGYSWWSRLKSLFRID